MNIKEDYSDWFDELGESQQADVLKGIEEADNGETVSHSQAIEIFGQFGLK